MTNNNNGKETMTSVFSCEDGPKRPRFLLKSLKSSF